MKSLMPVANGHGQRGRLPVCVGLLALVACALALLLFTSAASADLSFCRLGSAAGQCDAPQGLAADDVTGNVFVGDQYNSRIDVFDSAGNFIRAFGWGVDTGAEELETCTTASGCQAGIAGTGECQFGFSEQLNGYTVKLAVNDEAGSKSQHDVYVYDGRSRRVLKFSPEGACLKSFGSKGSGNGQFEGTDDPIAVGPGGVVYVGDSEQIHSGPVEFLDRVEKFDEEGNFIEAAALPTTLALEGALTVDQLGNLYLTYGGGIHRYDPSMAPIEPPLDPGVRTSALAVDAAGRLLAAQYDGGFPVITLYDAAGNHLSRFGYGELEFGGLGIAAHHSASGDVFATEENVGFKTQDHGNKVVYLTIPPAGPIVAPPSVEASEITNTRATLKAGVNPEGKETKAHFDYVDQKGFEEGGFSGPTVKHSPEVVIGSDVKLDPASYEATGLVPSTRYHFQVIASNEDATSSESAEFETRAPLEIEATWATEVGTDAATLHAELNPVGIEATGFFEYVDDATYQQSGFAEAKEAPEVSAGAGAFDFGEGEGAVAKSASLYPLSPGTTYHYRLVAKDSFFTIPSPEHTFITFAPPVPNTSCPNQVFRTAFSAPLPDCRAYEMVSPLDKNNGDILPLNEPTNHVPSAIDQSSLSGERLTYSSARAFAGAEGAPWNIQFLSRRGEDGWSTEGITPPRGLSTVNILGVLQGEFRAFSPDLCSGWLRSTAEPPLAPGAVEGFPNLYRRDNCGEGGYEALSTVTPPHLKPTLESAVEYTDLELQGLSADGTKAIYVAPDNLTPDAPVNSNLRYQLYEFASGQLHFVCMLPNGKASKSACSAGRGGGENFGKGLQGNVHNAISADGSRIYWTAYSDFTGAGQIYLRLNPDRAQSKVSAGKCTEAEKACTLPVSETVGSGEARYLTAAEDGSVAFFSLGGALYRFDAAKGESQPIAEGFLGMLGASEDASRIYFGSTEALAGGATAGQKNLYLYEAGEGGGSYSFIGALSDKDLGAYGHNTLSPFPFQRVARVTPDGSHAAFVSAASLSGYDNIDANNGKADPEVYLYDAAGNGGEGKLACASCNPSGARPVGADIGSKTFGASFWAAAQIPAWENMLYASRVLSDDGSRLFFESSDALVSTDTNGVQDVYEWEAPGSGDCTTKSDSFSKQDEGCIGLISSGQSPRDSEIVDASPSGEDVFIATLSSLLPQDYGLIDIYDARAKGGYPPPPNPPAACEGEACQGPFVPPDDPTPASSSFEGAGNVAEKPAKKKKAHKKKQAKRHTKHKRAKHSRRAGR